MRGREVELKVVRWFKGESVSWSVGRSIGLSEFLVRRLHFDAPIEQLFPSHPNSDSIPKVRIFCPLHVQSSSSPTPNLLVYLPFPYLTTTPSSGRTTQQQALINSHICQKSETNKWQLPILLASHLTSLLSLRLQYSLPNGSHTLKQLLGPGLWVSCT